VLLGAVWLVGTGIVGCGEDGDAARRRAKLRREQARRSAVTLKVGAPEGRAGLLRKLSRFLSSRGKPVGVRTSMAPVPELLQGLGNESLDLALVAGLPAAGERAALRALLGTLEVRLVGVDPVALVTNPSNRTGRLALVDVRSIFRGEATRWNQVAGDDLPMVAYTLDPPDSTSRLLGRALLDGAPIHPRVRRVSDVATQLESVRRTPGGLALVPWSRLPPLDLEGETARLKLLALAALRTSPGARPNDAAAVSQGRYALVLPVLLLVRQGEDRRARRLSQSLAGIKNPEVGNALGLPAPPPDQQEALRRRWIPPGP
jgi:hypothetical protein